MHRWIATGASFRRQTRLHSETGAVAQAGHARRTRTRPRHPSRLRHRLHHCLHSRARCVPSRAELRNLRVLSTRRRALRAPIATYLPAEEPALPRGAHYLLRGCQNDGYHPESILDPREALWPKRGGKLQHARLPPWKPYEPRLVPVIAPISADEVLAHVESSQSGGFLRRLLQ